MDSQDCPPSSFTPVPANQPIDSRAAAAWLDSIERRLNQIKIDLADVASAVSADDSQQIGGS